MRGHPLTPDIITAVSLGDLPLLRRGAAPYDSPESGFFLWRLRGLRRGCCLVCFEAFSSENLQWPPSDAELLYFCMHRRIELRSHDERDEIRARHCILIEHEPELEDIPKPIECFEELPFPDWTCIVASWRGRRRMASWRACAASWRAGGPAQHQGTPLFAAEPTISSSSRWARLSPLRMRKKGRGEGVRARVRGEGQGEGEGGGGVGLIFCQF